MLIKITSRRQITIPVRVMEALGVKAGNWIHVQETPGGLVLRRQRIDRSRLAPLRGKLPKGTGTFDLEMFRKASHARKERPGR